MRHLGYRDLVSREAVLGRQSDGRYYLPESTSEVADRLAVQQFESFQVTLVAETSGDLTALKLQYVQARADSMAVKVGDLQVDYKSHVAQLRKEGKRLEKLLAGLVDVRQYTSYFGNTTSNGSISFIGYG